MLRDSMLAPLGYLHVSQPVLFLSRKLHHKYNNGSLPGCLCPEPTVVPLEHRGSANGTTAAHIVLHGGRGGGTSKRFSFGHGGGGGGGGVLLLDRVRVSNQQTVIHDVEAPQPFERKNRAKPEVRRFCGVKQGQTG